MKSVRARLEELEAAAGRDGDGGGCPHCRTPHVIIEKDTPGGPAFCFFCGVRITLPVGRPVKLLIGVRGCL